MVRQLKNLGDRGITIIELLISISIGAIVTTMLLTILSTTLITRNHVDYMNRLDEEVYYINNHFETKVTAMNYRSIRVIESPEDVNYQIFLLTNEYDIIDGVLRYDLMYQMLVLMDIDAGEVYLIPVPDVGYTIPTPDVLDDPEQAYNSYAPLIENPPQQYRVSSSRLNVLPGSSMQMTCIATDNNNIYGNCSAAFIEFDFELSYTLTSGESLGQRSYNFTLIY